MRGKAMRSECQINKSLTSMRHTGHPQCAADIVKCCNWHLMLLTHCTQTVQQAWAVQVLTHSPQQNTCDMTAASLIQTGLCNGMSARTLSEQIAELACCCQEAVGDRPPQAAKDAARRHPFHAGAPT